MEDQTTKVEQETQNETPPETTGSDEQVKTQEKPAQTDSEAPPVETAQKTTDQLEADRKHYQAEYQATKAELKALRESTKTPDAPQAQPQQPVQSDMTPEQWNEKLQDEPLLAIQALSQHNEDVTRKMIDEGFTRMEARMELKNQSAEANRVVKDFCVRHKIDPKFIDEAYATIKELNIKGAPAQMAELALDMAQSNMSKDNGSLAAMKVAVETSEKVKAQALASAPDLGGQPSSPKSMSAQEGIAGRFKPIKGGGDMNRLLGG